MSLRRAIVIAAQPEELSPTAIKRIHDAVEAYTEKRFEKALSGFEIERDSECPQAIRNTLKNEIKKRWKDG